MDSDSTKPNEDIQELSVNKKTNSLAVVGLVLAFIFPLVGLILSIISLNQIKKHEEGGKGLATAGVILSSVFMLIGTLLLLIFVAGINSFTEKNNTIITTVSEKESSINEVNNSGDVDKEETVSQKNAVNKAKDYLSYTAFSYEGLIDQLKFEQFSHEDAVYGADNCGADWMDQAAKKAEDYMEYSSFSRGGLIDQLEFDKFTTAQATYGADSVGL